MAPAESAIIHNNMTVSTSPDSSNGQGWPKIIEKRILADVETPLSAYWKLAHDEPYSFLLESVTGGEHVSRWSFLGVRPRTVLKTKDRRVVFDRPGSTEDAELPSGSDPLDLLKELLGPKVDPVASGLPPFIGGAVGLLGYDLVRFFEKLPDSTTDDLQADDLAMMLTSTVVAFDHAKNEIRIIGIASSSEEAARVEAEISRIAALLAGPLPPLPSGEYPSHPVESTCTQPEFEAMVSKLRDYIVAGDGVQFVPSQRFRAKVDAHPVTVYRALRSINPSPYMFILRLHGSDIVGASPELLVSLHGRTAHLRPIAGTRGRGKDDAEDRQLAEELLADEKERAEHVMLVDLARNDLGRVCEYGSVEVNDLMIIERYSHVMHIVSDVTGVLRPELDAYSLFRACFPAGTVSGAPKIRAMEVIDEVEPTRRGVYAGSIGFFSATGDMDTCIAIRTIFIKDGWAYVQAGGGTVFDAVPVNEYFESCRKAKASLRAIELAQQGLSKGTSPS